MEYSTSGTVGRTVIDTAMIIEHAFRRCRVLPSAQTPETVQTAKDNLYFLMLNVGNRGLNLWAVEPVLLGVNAGRALYTMPKGTLDVLNVVYSQSTLVPTVFIAEPFGGMATLTSVASILRIGIKLAVEYTGKLLVEGSADGITFKTLLTTQSNTFGTQAYNWTTLPVTEPLLAFRVTAASLQVTDIQVASGVYDLPCTPWNRDAFMALNNKSQTGRPSTNYFFEKKLTPTLTMWPVPNNGLDCLSLYVHRQSQDIGTLTQQIEMPQRWLDGIIWMLAARLCFELPTVDATWGQTVIAMAGQQELEAEAAESDGMPVYLQPAIRCYNT